MPPSEPQAQLPVSSVQEKEAPPDPEGAGPPDAPSAREQLERVRARDPEALAAFYERHVDRVYALAYRLLGERAAAEDITQEVFLKVHRAAPQLDASRDPGPWLTAIVTNACRDLWRSGAHRMGRRSDSIEAEGGLSERLTAGRDEPERQAIARERERLVQRAILALPEPLRVAIVLHDYEGLDHLEIAKLTGVAHAAARKRYSRALATLAKRLREVLR